MVAPDYLKGRGRASILCYAEAVPEKAGVGNSARRFGKMASEIPHLVELDLGGRGNRRNEDMAGGKIDAVFVEVI